MHRKAEEEVGSANGDDENAASAAWARDIPSNLMARTLVKQRTGGDRQAVRGGPVTSLTLLCSLAVSGYPGLRYHTRDHALPEHRAINCLKVTTSSYSSSGCR
jgi:hypothetical protein